MHGTSLRKGAAHIYSACRGWMCRQLLQAHCQAQHTIAAEQRAVIHSLNKQIAFTANGAQPPRSLGTSAQQPASMFRPIEAGSPRRTHEIDVLRRGPQSGEGVVWDLVRDGQEAEDAAAAIVYQDHLHSDVGG